MKSDYEQRKANRIERYLVLAKKNAQKAEQQSAQASVMASAIPMGQPILIGHHSKKRDRSYREKIDNLQRKSIESQAKSDHYAHRAESTIQNDSISSDDPQAIEKLREKLSAMEKKQGIMKAANKIIQNGKYDETIKIAKLVEIGLNEQAARKLLVPMWNGKGGYERFELSNNSQNMTRTRKRIEQLEKQSKVASNEITVNGIRIFQNMEANRLQLFFPDKPVEEVREQLKRSGFRWSPREGAWQRQVSRAAQYAALDIVKSIRNEEQS
ncbi:MAG TPA: DUF3560 domain-containing protein [Ohtaekwangia sp.]|uniref:DUF3560 domain-containing protein n=1 Tax=Ohtaekwangia sp. TaxID=2066019 RepID=UPI002F9228F4